MAKTLNLLDYLPESPSGSRGLLPKQELFYNACISTARPHRYVLYGGGVGSGKTIIGCLTILTMAIMHSGDYLVARQFLPELKLTTYKTFLEICPKELIVEHRVADLTLKIRSQDGGISNVIFRGMDEPDKHRSLNLNAAYIDEASQVSEAAFVLLQSRLRGKAFRRIIMTTNPNGHSWLYRLFIKKDVKEEAKPLFYHITATSLENINLPEDYVQNMLSTYSHDRIQREIMGSWDAFEGQVYDEFSRNIHVVKPFAIPTSWTRWVGADHGFRNPAAMVWLAKDYDDNIYVYREYYQSGRTIKEIVKDFVTENRGEKIDGIWIDPSTKADRGKESDFTTYLEYLPKEISLIGANNDVTVGIDQVKQLLKVHPVTHKPQLFIFDTCPHLLEEIVSYKYEELTPGMEGIKNIKETPVKKNDHAIDALRYAVMAKADKPLKQNLRELKKQENTLTASVMRDFDRAKGLEKPKDPWGEQY